MIFQLDFKGPYHNMGMRLENALVVRDLHGLFLLFWNKKFPFHVF